MRKFVPLALSVLAGLSTFAAATTLPVPAARALAPPATGAVTIDASSRGATIAPTVRGANMAVWFNITQAGIADEFQSTGLRSTRWPGGSDADLYHWKTQTECGGGDASPYATFDNFMRDIALPARLSVSVTLNYGSNAACNAGGDPSEAAAWVAYANDVQHYGITYWTVGNEVYGGWEYDLHKKPHDPTTYANAVTTGFYPRIKAKDPTAQVGVVVDGNAAWDKIVLTKAKYDFVEFHYYAQGTGSENDAYLIGSAAPALVQAVAALRREMTTYGVPTTVPIYLGELGSVSPHPGKQTSSITQALFAGQAVADLMNLGIQRATWWIGNGGCSDPSNGNFSKSLYGWQNFGGYMLFSDGLPEYGCMHAPPLGLGTPLPTARAYQLLAHFGGAGGTMLSARVSRSLPLVRVYGATNQGRYSVLLFNLSKTSAADVTVSVAHAWRSRYAGLQTIYDKQLYDASKSGMWLAPTVTNLGTISPTFGATLSPWSITVIDLS